MNAFKLPIALGLGLTFFSLHARAQSPRPVKSSACTHPVLSLRAMLAAHDQQSGVKSQRASVRKMLRRARSSAWLPRLMLSAEHRLRDDQGQDAQIAAALKMHARHEQALVFRAQMRWNLDRLVYHHATLSALRFSQHLSQAHQDARKELAVQYSQWRMLWDQHCQGGTPDPAQIQRAALLRATLIAATGQSLPKIPWSRRQSAPAAPIPASNLRP